MIAWRNQIRALRLENFYHIRRLEPLTDEQAAVSNRLQLVRDYKDHLALMLLVAMEEKNRLDHTLTVSSIFVLLSPHT